jgi:ABC-type multidrug transport system, ATPase and permease components
MLVASVVAVLDPWSVLILLIAGPMLVLLLGLIGRRVRDLAERRERELAWMNAHFLDVLRGLPTLKMFGRSAEQAETIRAVSRRQGSSTMDVLRTGVPDDARPGVGRDRGHRARRDRDQRPADGRRVDVRAGARGAAAHARVLPAAAPPVGRIPRGQFGNGRPRRVYAVLDARARIHVPASGAARPLPARLDVRFDDVVVTYDEGSRTALAGCSLQIPQGRTVALVGPTGAGKTTVANVLLRFVDPDRGRVTVGGAPLTEIDPASWRTRVAWVPQQASLFHGTVADNLRLARPDASDDDLVAAATAANAHGFVTDLPEGTRPRSARGCPLERRRASAPRARASLPEGCAVPDPGRAHVAPRP